MLNCFSQSNEKTAIPITLVTCDQFPDWLARQSAVMQQWIKANNFTGVANTYLLILQDASTLKEVIVVVLDKADLNYLGDLAQRLPEAVYQLQEVDLTQWQRAAIAWGLGTYQFTRYKQGKNYPAKLRLPDSLPIKFIENLLKSIYTVRDLINTPTQDMSPQDLAEATKHLATQYGAKFHEIVGDNLLKQNFPAIHAVGRASIHAPRFLELTWGDANHPQIVLVGKGVCFDSGGYDLKSSDGMRWMKKDMGGAAHALGLAQLIMAEQLPIRLTVLIPAVENLVAGNAYKPGDVLATRKGLTIEIGNTDAEGRVILADALAYAVEQSPELIIDFATLTGAARVALGTDIAVLFSNQPEQAAQLSKLSFEINDPIWPLPLYQPYRELLNTYIADMSNNSSSPYGGAITAALFLQSFVAQIPWLHFDLMAWNLRNRPAHPEGGEAMGLYAVYQWLNKQYGN